MIEDISGQVSKVFLPEMSTEKSGKSPKQGKNLPNTSSSDASMSEDSFYSGSSVTSEDTASDTPLVMDLDLPGPSSGKTPHSTRKVNRYLYRQQLENLLSDTSDESMATSSQTSLSSDGKGGEERMKPKFEKALPSEGKKREERIKPKTEKEVLQLASGDEGMEISPQTSLASEDKALGESMEPMSEEKSSTSRGKPSEESIESK